MGEEGQRESLNYKLLGTTEDLGGWGHEYVRHLAGEIGDEYNERLGAADEGGKPAAELLPLILEKMLPFFMAHNTESEAIDLLMEVGRLDELLPHIDATNCDRVVMYLVQVASYVPEPEDGEVLLIAVKCRRKLGKAPEALRLALRLGDMALVEEILTSCDDELAQKQMAYAPPPPAHFARLPRRAAARPRFPPSPSPTRPLAPHLQVHAGAAGAAPRGGGGPGAPDGRHAHDRALPRARARPRRVGAEDA